MFIIGHRGAAGLAPENTIESFDKAIELDVDMIELDVRLTKDNVPVVIHDATFYRTHQIKRAVNNVSYQYIKDNFKDLPIPTLEKVLKRYFGKVLINIELKSRGSAEIVYRLLNEKFVKNENDWDLVLISSFRGLDLIKLRKLSKKINLAMLHEENPFVFFAFHRRLNLTAVGFHRLYVNPLAMKFAKKAGIFTYAYTVNRAKAAKLLQDSGIDGIVTNFPDRIPGEESKQ